MKRQTTFKVLYLLAAVGFLVSLYLVQNHFAPPEEGSFCDFGESLSCSLVNTSVFSKLLNIPVSLLGAIWFVFLYLFTRKVERKQEFAPVLFWWSILGILFVVYFIIAEIILEALCPFCTIVHVIVLISFILSLQLYRKDKKHAPLGKLLPKLKTLIALFVILNLIPLIYFNLPRSEAENYDALAKCITEKGINMYSSFRCSHCARQRALLGDSFQYINEIECHPQGEHSQTELCFEKDVKGTPTFIMEPDGKEIKREVGYMTIEELREFSGCTE